VTIPNKHSFHSTVTERRHMYTDVKKQLVRPRQLKTAYIMPLVLTTTVAVPSNLHDRLMLFNLNSGQYSNAENLIRAVELGFFFGRAMNKKCWSMSPVLLCKPANLLWSKECRWYSWFHIFAIFWIFYAFFWVILRRLNFMSRRFGTLYLFHLHRQVVVDWLVLRNVGLFIREKVWLESSLSHWLRLLFPYEYPNISQT